MVKMYLDAGEYAIYDLRFTRVLTFGVRSSMLDVRYFPQPSALVPLGDTTAKNCPPPLRRVNRQSPIANPQVTASDAYLRLMTVLRVGGGSEVSEKAILRRLASAKTAFRRLSSPFSNSHVRLCALLWRSFWMGEPRSQTQSNPTGVQSSWVERSGRACNCFTSAAWRLSSIRFPQEFMLRTCPSAARYSPKS